MDRKTGLLLVEGQDDLHVFMNLFEKHDVPRVFTVREHGGIDPLLESLPVQMKRSDVRAIGVVVDADVDVRQRWCQLRNVLVEQGFGHLPEKPPGNGLVVERDNDLRVGVWVMPDNKLPGQLEDFVTYMVPEEDTLWPRARASVEDIPTGERLFKSQDFTKAILHTWLAWQEQPGVPPGRAIGYKYLQPEVPEAARFVAWIRRLFEGAV